MKRRVLERHLRDYGASVTDAGRNHTEWRGPDGARTVVLRHNEIGAGRGPWAPLRRPAVTLAALAPASGLQDQERVA